MAIDEIIKKCETRMEQAIGHSQQVLQRVRAGRASAEMVAHLRVDYYGTQTPLEQTATIIALDARRLQIKPWEKSLIDEIERTIQQSDLGLTPQNDGEAVLLNIPPLSEERRKQVLKQAKQEAEQGRIRIRNLRKEANEAIKKNEDSSEDERKTAEGRIQTLTDKFIAQIDTLIADKEAEIMHI